MDKIDDINRNAAADITDKTPSRRDGLSAMAAAAGVAAAGKKRRRRSGAANARGSGPYREFWTVLSRMPPLSHWPDRSEPFDPARSEVYSFILRECGLQLGFHLGAPVALDCLGEEDFRLLGRIQNSARERGAICFDPTTKLWRGMALPWLRYRKPSEIAAERARYHEEARRRCARIRVCEDCGEWFDDDHAFRNHRAEHRSFHPEFDPNRIPELR
jgi:hypothetical protein